MDITVYISRFLYRIRYQLLFGSMLVTLLVAYFTQFLPKTYTEAQVYIRVSFHPPIKRG